MSQQLAVGRQSALEAMALDAYKKWARQIAEHQLILLLGLADDQLKGIAEALFYRWMDIIPTPELRYEEVDWAALFDLMTQTKGFQQEVLNLFNSRHWIGWIDGAYLEHILTELDYFERKVQQRPLTIDEEILFWMEIFGEHAAEIAKLLDARERADIFRGNRFADAALELIQRYQYTTGDPEMETMRRISRRYVNDLDRWYHELQGKTNIRILRNGMHPLLIAHIEREHRWGIEMIESIVNASTQL